MKTILCILAAALLCGCYHQESEYDRMNRAVDAVCSKEICGFQRVVCRDWEILGSNVVVTAEFINTAGGWERTNLPVCLYEKTWMMDYVELQRRDVARLKKEQEDFLKMMSQKNHETRR